MSGGFLSTSHRFLRARVARCLACVCTLLIAFGFSAVATAQPWLPIQGQGAGPQREPAGYLISRTPHPSIARIVVPEKNGASFGSGSLVNVTGDHGLVVTNWHVVRDASGPIYAFFGDGYQSEATVVKVDRDWDLAALSVKKPPTAIPVTIAQHAPRAGDWLCIAGYGSGDYRAAAGRCTQYVSPATNLPYEMVEVAAEARQGDSGGPILNERGELAGVLFGSGSGTTSGSYSGRVLAFLQGVLPTTGPVQPLPLAQQPVPQQPLPQHSLDPQGLAVQPPAPLVQLNAPPAADAHLFTASDSKDLLPSTSGSATVSPAEEVNDSARTTEMAHLETPPRPLMPLPTRRDEPLTLVTGEEPVGEDRTALRPTPAQTVIPGRELHLKEATLGPLPAEALNIVHTPLPARIAASTPLETAPADQLLAAAWKQVGGSTLFDQGKTLLAVLGLLGLLTQFWRMNSRPDHPDDD